MKRIYEDRDMSNKPNPNRGPAARVQKPAEQAAVTEETTAVAEETEAEAPAEVAAEAPAETTETAAPAPAPEVVVAKEPETALAYLEKRHRDAAIPLEVHAIIERLDKYIVGMNPKGMVSEKDGVGYQRSLNIAMQLALGMHGGYHGMAIDVIQWYFTKYRDQHFTEANAFRFLSDLKLSKQANLAFRGLVTLFMTTARTGNRSNSTKTVMIRQIVDNLPDQTMQSNLLSYYM